MEEKLEAFVIGMLTERVNRLVFFPTDWDLKKELEIMKNSNDTVAKAMEIVDEEKLLKDWWFIGAWLYE